MARRPNAAWLRPLLATAVAGVIAAGFAGLACSAFDADPTPAGDSGAAALDGDPAETSTPPADTGVAVVVGKDGGLAPTPNRVDCFGATCDITGTDCCINGDGDASCKTKCASDELDFPCDDRADCNGRVCCLTYALGIYLSGTQCETTCASGLQLCSTNEECPTGKTCVPQRCRGRTIGTCGVYDVSYICDAGAR